jgi:hypothetical protein
MSARINIQKQTTVLHEILKWSAEQPDWQRDTLRRIVEKGNLVETDLLELECICRGKHQVDTSNLPPIQCVHLTQTHLPPVPGAAELEDPKKSHHAKHWVTDTTIFMVAK